MQHRIAPARKTKSLNSSMGKNKCFQFNLIKKITNVSRKRNRNKAIEIPQPIDNRLIY